ncbi:MAG: rhomboid family intramembrane serine protease [Bradyrhizobiaceae bacterium]|nr:rhomboid family intramembrane serine protease [Bradyrhizobiaceae bacterium]
MEQARAGEAGAPWLTLALLAVLIIVFFFEVGVGLDPNTGFLQPSLHTLVALGGSNWNLVVGGGEWFRVISAPFLHAGLLHLALNGLVLLWGGSFLERLLGRAWFAAIYAVSSVSGGLMSLAVNPPTVVSVGASGALMGLMASLFVTSFHFPPGPVRTRLLTAALQVLVPSLIPVFTAITGQRVDFGAHLGGALGGAVMALVLLGVWPRSERWPRLQWLAAAIAVAGFLAVMVTAWKVHGSFTKARRDLELQAMLIPDNQFPRSDADWKAKVDELVARYPHDPRPRLFRGITLLDAGDLVGAERELRAGLDDVPTFQDVLPPQVEALLRTNLASALSAEQNTTEAKAIAEPVCRRDTAETRSLRSRLRRLGLCD